ncbi:hypothetical protein [Dysgonomonas sp.]
MKTKTLTFLVLVVFVLPVCGQLNTVHNHLRPDDVLIKRQTEPESHNPVEYISPKDES